MATIKMTTSQYAKRAGYSGRQAVQYRIDNNLEMDGVINKEFTCGRYLLDVDLSKVKKKRLKKVA